MPNSFPYDAILSRMDEMTDPPTITQPCSECGQPIDTYNVSPWDGGWNCDSSGKVWHIECPPKAEHIEDEIPY
jgi:hypothetical protein